jgi:hypothetical protein
MFNILNNIANNSTTYFPIPQINSIADILGMILNILMGVSFALGFIGIGYAMVLFVTSRGDPKATTKAYNAFIWSVGAIILTIIAFAVKAIILGLGGVTNNNLTNELPDF